MIVAPTPAALPKLLYLHDPLCGWCYGMSPVINRVQTEFAGRVDVSVLCGGMAVGARAMPIAETWGYIKNTLLDVEKVARVQFGPAFKALAEEGRFVYDSEPPCRAIVAFRQLTHDPARAVVFAHAVQTALFCDGCDLNRAVTYEALLAEFGVDAADFQRCFVAPETARATQQEFAAVARIGVRNFPASVLRLGGQGYVLARGYQPYEPLRQGLEQLLREAKV